jgi:4-amino-4-deoxy-L-arabinose transferase-like glycosyltransferase
VPASGAKGPRARRLRHAAGGWPARALLLAWCLALYLPAFATLPVVDRDESRFARAAQAMAFPESATEPGVGERGPTPPMPAGAITGRPTSARPTAVHDRAPPPDAVLQPGRDDAPAAHSRATERLVAADPAAAAPGARAQLGRWLVPRLDDRLRLDKPPLLYWLQAASIRAAVAIGWAEATTIWPYRLPSLLAAILACWLTHAAGCRLGDPRAALLGAALLAASPLVLWETRQGRADLVLLAAAAFALWAFSRLAAARHPRGTMAALLWLAVFLGALTKWSPVPWVVAAALLTWALLPRPGRQEPPGSAGTSSRDGGSPSPPLGAWQARWRELARFRPLAGGLALGAAVGAVLAAQAAAVGEGPVLEVFWREVGARALAAREGHGGPPGTHLVWLPVLLGAGTLGLAGGLRRGVRLAWRGRPAERALVAWLGGWIGFELAATKLPAYPLPIYPAIALLAARWLLAATASGGRAVAGPGGNPDHPGQNRRPPGRGVAAARVTGRTPRDRVPRWLVALWVLLQGLGLPAALLALAVFLAAQPPAGTPTALPASLPAWVPEWLPAWSPTWFSAWPPAGPPALFWLALPVAGLLALAAAAALRRPARLLPALLGSLLAWGLATVGAIVGLANAPQPWIGHQLVTVFARLDPAHQRPWGDAAWREASPSFLTAGRLLPVADPDAWLAARPEGLLALPAGGPAPAGSVELARFSGFDLIHGEPLAVAVVTLQPTTSVAAPASQENGTR